MKSNIFCANISLHYVFTSGMSRVLTSKCVRNFLLLFVLFITSQTHTMMTILSHRAREDVVVDQFIDVFLLYSSLVHMGEKKMKIDNKLGAHDFGNDMHDLFFTFNLFTLLRYIICLWFFNETTTSEKTRIHYSILFFCVCVWIQWYEWQFFEMRKHKYERVRQTG